MRFRSIIAAAAVTVPLAGVLAAAVAPTMPLIVDGSVTVDALDIQAYALRIPEIHRPEVMASADRIATMADNLFIARTLAGKAREAGLDQDPAVQRRMAQQQEALLADLYLQRIENQVQDINLEARARELFNADQKKFAGPDHVRVQYLMVSLYGRTREMAAERARELYTEATSGKADFLELAGRYSEDPDKNRNGGDLGFRPLDSFPDQIARRLDAMKQTGEVSEPIETTTGFHIVRYLGRKKAPVPRFEAVRDSIIKAERERIAKERHEALLREIRSSKTVTVYRKNVEALVAPIADTSDKTRPKESSPK